MKKSPNKTRGTLAYFRKVTWGSMNRRSVNGSCPGKSKQARHYHDQGVELRMTRSEFYDWCNKHKAIIMSLYSRGITPSIDRIAGLHYELENIRVVSRGKNSSMGAKRSSGGAVTGIRLSKPIMSVDDVGNIVEYASSMEAERAGFNRPHIVECLRGKRKTHGGFKWKYKN